MGYRNLTRKLEQREAALLSREPLEDGVTVPYDQVAPGFYPDEYLVKPDDLGEEVAVSVERKWLENGSGVGFHAYARVVEHDGRTKLTADGKHMEAAVTWNAGPHEIETYGADALATDMARIVLGEYPQVTRSVPVEEGEPEILPIINLSRDVLNNASIRFQVQAVKAATKTTLKL